MNDFAEGIILALFLILIGGIIWIDNDNPCARWSDKDELVIVGADPPVMIPQKVCLERQQQ